VLRPSMQRREVASAGGAGARNNYDRAVPATDTEAPGQESSETGMRFQDNVRVTTLRGSMNIIRDTTMSCSILPAHLHTICYY